MIKRFKILTFCVMVVIHLIYSTSYAGDNKIYPITNDIKTQRSTTSQIICIDGYKYLITQTQHESISSQSGFGVSVVQMLKRGKDNGSQPPQPIKCQE